MSSFAEREAELAAWEPTTRRDKVARALELAHLRGTPYRANPEGGPPLVDYGVFADAALDAGLPTDEEVEHTIYNLAFEPYESPDRDEIVRAVLHLFDPPDEGVHELDVMVEKMAKGWRATGTCFSCRRIWTAEADQLGYADQAVRSAHWDYLELPTQEPPVLLVGRHTATRVTVTDRRMPRAAH
jgi:hypothetical protein